MACPFLNKPTNGNVSLATDGAVTIAVFTCSLGYNVNGLSTLICQSSGLWDGVEPSCGKCDRYLYINCTFSYAFVGNHADKNLFTVIITVKTDSKMHFC